MTHKDHRYLDKIHKCAHVFHVALTIRGEKAARIRILSLKYQYLRETFPTTKPESAFHLQRDFFQKQVLEKGESSNCRADTVTQQTQEPTVLPFAPLSAHFLYSLSQPFPCSTDNQFHTHIVGGLQRVCHPSGADFLFPVS